MRKTLLTLILPVFAFVLILGLSGCNRNNPVDSSDPTLSSMIAADIQDDVSDVTEPSVDNNVDMALMPMYNDAVPYQIPMMSEMMIKHGFINFMKVMRLMSLTDAQKVTLIGYLVDYRDCIHTAQVALRASEKVILDAANVQLKAIMQDLKNGTITKAEARMELATLALNTRADLKNNPEKATFKTAVCACLETLFADIRADLTDTQQALWDAWVATLRNPCIP